jgi:GT2 family glycosyltransferase
MTPLVSVVVPTHNRARLLSRTLRSILAQQMSDLEVIVVDDGSTDGTQASAAAADRRVRVVRNQVATGVSRARNLGIAMARAEWVAFCDDDDLWAPEKLGRQLTAAERGHSDWAYGGDVNVDHSLRILSGGRPPDPETVVAVLPRSNPLASGGSNVLVRARTLAAVGGFDPSLRRTEDWDLWIRLARAGPPAWVCEPLVAYRFHDGNITANPDEMVDEARRLAVRHGISVDFAAMHRRAAWAALRGGRRLLALRHYGAAVARGDFRSLGRAAVALVHPGVGTNRLFALVGREAAWIAEADRWLQAFARMDPPAESRTA